MARSKHEYVVGYVGDKECVYGQPTTDGDAKWIDPMTLHQARRELRDWDSSLERAIYRLVPVETLPPAK